jgi:dihydrofolate reductase
MPTPFNLIVACAENRVIGREGRLPWRIPEDWQLFRRQTAGATVILGRISFQSWRSVLEDDRRVVVLTRDRSLAGDRVEVAESLPSALGLAAAHGRPIYVCGGQRIFEEAIKLPQAERLFLTLVHAELPGDRTFPEWTREFPRVLERRESADANFRYTFLSLAREPNSSSAP